MTRILLLSLPAAGLFWVVSTRGVDPKEISAAGSVGIRAPQGTTDVRAVSNSVEGRIALAIREKNTGKFGIWILDVESGEFRRISSRLFRVPVAVGLSATQEVLVLEAVRGGVDASVLSEKGIGQQWLIEDTLPRTAREFTDCGARDGSWLIGGVFRQGEQIFGGMILGGSHERRYLFPMKDVPEWIGAPGTNFTRLVSHTEGYALTNSVVPTVRFYDRQGLPAHPSWPLERYVPSYTAPSRAGDPPFDKPPEAYRKWLNSWDCPDEICRVMEQLALLVRRPDRNGHLLVLIDEQGARKGVARLPRSLGPPMSSHGDRILLISEGEEGQPARLVLLRPETFMNDGFTPYRRCGQLRIDERPEITMAVSYPTLSHPDLLILKPESCRGDLVRATVSAISPSMQGRRFTLALVTRPESRERMSEEYVESIFRQVRRHVPLESRILMVDHSVPLPRGARELPKGVGHLSTGERIQPAGY